ncbi:hypothetical protein RhiirC2_202018 [Rhizophagus irregularis]|uniref:Uncharacterized protein n=1 Tax=Rhizophagus irregularis TaxID=588596 RepID=A0A2N1MJD5_9GLOM|nr:hypothetical protein RhiirC2_202018 [Rhizophagus irregularis]
MICLLNNIQLFPNTQRFIYKLKFHPRVFTLLNEKDLSIRLETQIVAIFAGGNRDCSGSAVGAAFIVLNFRTCDLCFILLFYFIYKIEYDFINHKLRTRLL